MLALTLVDNPFPMPLATKESIYISDELNHNCIIQAMRLSRPQGKAIYKHNDMADLEAKLQEWAGKTRARAPPGRR